MIDIKGLATKLYKLADNTTKKTRRSVFLADETWKAVVELSLEMDITPSLCIRLILQDFFKETVND